MSNLNYTAAQIEAFLENVDNAGARKVETTYFVRADNVVATSVPVSITVNGVTKTGANTKNAAGENLSIFCADMSENNAVFYTRTDPVTYDPYTKVHTRTKNIGTVEINQQRTVTRNAAREILSITRWTTI